MFLKHIFRWRKTSYSVFQARRGQDRRPYYSDEASQLFMKTTHYFRTSVMIRRPYLQEAWIEQVLKNPIQTEKQANGRIRHWAFIPALGKHLRVVTESDAETVHSAFPDRGFQKETGR